MKTLLKLSCTLLFAAALTSCGGGDDPSDHDHDHSGHDHSSAAQTTGDADYPLTTCVVSGEALGSMGTPVEVSHKGTIVKLCCDSCIDDFNKTPEVFVAKLNAGGEKH